MYMCYSSLSRVLLYIVTYIMALVLPASLSMAIAVVPQTGDGLCVGSFASTTDSNALVSLGITHIIHAMRDAPVMPDGVRIATRCHVMS